MKVLRLVLTFVILNSSLQIANAQWTTNGPYSGEIACFAVMDSTIFAGTYDDGIFRSTNLGDSWTQVNSGLPPGNEVISMVVSGSAIFAAVPAVGGIYISTNNGDSWALANTGLTDTNVLTLAVCGTHIFAGTLVNFDENSSQYGDGGVYVSANNGASWYPVNHSLPIGYGTGSLVASDTTIFVALDTAIFYSTDYGAHWVSIHIPAPYLGNELGAFAVCDSGIFIQNTSGDLSLSKDLGQSWQLVFSNVNFTSFFVQHQVVYAAGNYEFVMFAKEDTNWVDIGNPEIRGPGIIYNVIAAIDTSIFAGTSSGIYVSSDSGSSWATANNGFTETQINKLVAGDSGIYAGTAHGIFLSADSGNNWAPANNGVPGFGPNDGGLSQFPYFGYYPITALVAYGKNIFTCANNHLYSSGDNGNSWNEVSNYFDEYIVTSDSLMVLYGEGDIVVSSDSGKHWSNLSGDLSGYSTALIIDSTFFIASYNTGMLYTSLYLLGDIYYDKTDCPDTGLTNVDITSLASRGSTIFAGTLSGVFLSRDAGKNWIAVNNGLTDLTVNTLYTYGQYIFAGTTGGLFVSANNGANWIPLGLSGSGIISVLVKGATVFAGTSNNAVWQRTLPVIDCSAGFALYTDSNAANSYYALNQATGTGPLAYVWNWGDGDTSAGVAPSHTYADSGYYTICLTITDSTGCTNSYCDSDAYLRSTQALTVNVNVVTSLPTGTGLPVVDAESTVFVYPNPNSVGSWQLTVDNNLVGSALEVYDEQGRLVFHSAISNQNSEIKFDAAPGVYYLRISNENVSVVRKLVKM